MLTKPHLVVQHHPQQTRRRRHNKACACTTLDGQSVHDGVVLLQQVACTNRHDEAQHQRFAAGNTCSQRARAWRASKLGKQAAGVQVCSDDDDQMLATFPAIGTLERRGQAAMVRPGNLTCVQVRSITHYR